MKSSASAPNFAILVQNFFCQRLIQEQNASARTVASYRDTFRLLLAFLQKTKRKQPTALKLADLDAPTISSFLQHLEKQRRNTIRTRNTRFAAIRSFMRFAAVRDPSALPITQRVLTIPMKRFARPVLRYLSRDEVDAILDAPDPLTWSGHRDRVLFALLYNTGARVSEVIALRQADVHPRSIQLTGKGRKQRVIPLWKNTAKRLRDWMRQLGQNQDAPLFPNRDGKPLSRSGVEKRLWEAVQTAAGRCATLRAKRVSPHVFRHTTAMHMLQADVNLAIISMWLGHESAETTHQYVEANLDMKDRALSKIEEVKTKRVRYRAGDKLLQFLDGL